MNRNKLYIVLLLFVQGALFSCVNTRKAVYFNNIQDTVLKNALVATEPIIQKNDLLNINVSSLNPDASVIFNTPNVSAPTVGSTPSGYTGGITATGAPSTPNALGSGQTMGYLVGPADSIKFPVLGNMKAGGLTKRQLEDEITAALIDKKLLIDPIVNVRFLNFRVTVLGEVARPSTINVSNERISILEALGLAGDLTIFSKRDNVLLIREDGNEKIVKRLDLNSSSILTSPYYYLKTNDVVYVEPNRAKVASADRTTQLLPILLSGLSLIAIILSYYIK